MTLSPPILRVRAVRVYERPVRLRLPFRFGDVRVTETAEAFAELDVETVWGRRRGISAQLMVPRWFDKRANLSNDETVEELRGSVRAAADAAIGLSDTVAGAARTLRVAVEAAMPETPRLAAGFGPALLEMALVDAACSDADVAFPAAARADLFGLAALDHDGLSPDALTAALAALTPRWRIGLRHTVGYDAPLAAADVVERPDAEPVALSEVIAATGARAFKIKLKGAPSADLARLEAVAAVLDDGPAYIATLDANEQYAAEDFAVFLEGLAANPRLARLRASTLFFEQPYPREIALADDGPAPPAGAPIVIDESDDHDGAFAVALARGWAGVSVKSCKGVLRALLNAARAAVARRAGRPVILTAEDLTCQPGLCWQQDTLMAATVGAEHVERNGHHFAGAMQGAAAAERARFLEAHPDLYAPSARGPALRIEHGEIAFASLDAPGFASTPAPDHQVDALIVAKEESAP